MRFNRSQELDRILVTLMCIARYNSVKWVLIFYTLTILLN